MADAPADPADEDRLNLIELLATADGQEWDDFWENAHQRQIGEHMYGAQVDAILASWQAPLLAERDAARAQLAAVRVIVQSALVEHEPPAEVITGVLPACPTCHVPAPCGTSTFLAAAIDAAGRDDGGWVRPLSTPEATR